MHRNQHLRVQCIDELSQVFYGGMPAGVGIDKVDCRVVPEGGNSVTTEVLGVVSVEIAEPLRVDHVGGSGVVLEFVDEVKAGHLAEVEECFRSRPQFLQNHPVAENSRAEIAKILRIAL